MKIVQAMVFPVSLWKQNLVLVFEEEGWEEYWCFLNFVLEKSSENTTDNQEKKQTDHGTNQLQGTKDQAQIILLWTPCLRT